MAIIKCPDCGKEISDRAEACPNCGCPIAAKPVYENAPVAEVKKKKKTGIIIAIIAVIIIAAAAVLVFVLGGSGVKEITLSENNLELNLKGTHSVTYTVLPEDISEETTVVWSSSDENVATVSDYGEINAVGAGSCTITATAGRKSASVSVTVNSMPEEYMIIGNEVIALEDFAEEIKDNEVKFDSKYKGKTVTIVARVKEIEGGFLQTNLNHTFKAVITLNGGSFMNKFCVEAGSKSKASQFEIGDLIKVEGKLTTDLYGTSFYMYGPNTITKVTE